MSGADSSSSPLPSCTDVNAGDAATLLRKIPPKEGQIALPRPLKSRSVDLLVVPAGSGIPQTELLYKNYQDCQSLVDSPRGASVEDARRLIEWTSIELARRGEFWSALSGRRLDALIEEYRAHHRGRLSRQEIKAYRHILTLFMRYARF